MYDRMMQGLGSPEGLVSAQRGSLYLDRQGGLIYRKGTDGGTTGWVALADDLPRVTRQPDWDSYLAWTDDPALATTTYKPASGNLMVAFTRAGKGKAAGAALAALYNITTTGAGLTSAYIAVYNAVSGTRVAMSADLSATWNGGTGVISTPLTVSSAISVGDYLYVGVVSSGTTTPTFAAPGASTVMNAAGLAVKRGVRSGQTVPPTPLGALSTATQVPWLALA